MALHATTIRFADRTYTAIAYRADAQGISVSQYVREAALIRAVLHELDTAEDAIHASHDLLAVAREVRRLGEVDAPGAPRANARSRGSTPLDPAIAHVGVVPDMPVSRTASMRAWRLLDSPASDAPHIDPRSAASRDEDQTIRGLLECTYCLKAMRLRSFALSRAALIRPQQA